MTPENSKLPDWAQRERESDLHLIAENQNLFWTSAALAFVETGRGAIVVDTTIQFMPDAGHPFGYVSQEQIEETANEETQCMVNEYYPSQEFVIALLNPAAASAPTEYASCHRKTSKLFQMIQRRVSTANHQIWRR